MMLKMYDQCAYLDVVDMSVIPDSANYLVTKPQHEKINDYFLAQIVIHSKDLLFSPIRIQRLLQFARALEVMTKGFLNLST